MVARQYYTPKEVFDMTVKMIGYQSALDPIWLFIQFISNREEAVFRD